MSSHTQPDHDRHDLALIAAHAAGDLSDTERAAADVLMTACETCADLRGDLVAIAAATRSLPAPMAANRDFQLEPAQAERLQRGSWLRNILRPFGTQRSVVRPLAAAFTSLGVAGLFIALTLPTVLVPYAAPGAFERQGLAVQSDASVVAGLPKPTSALDGQLGPLRPVAASSDTDFHGNAGEGSSSGKDGETPENATGVPPVANAGGAATPAPVVLEDRVARLAAQDPIMNVLVLGSTFLLAFGLLLFGIRLAARRLR